MGDSHGTANHLSVAILNGGAPVLGAPESKALLLVVADSKSFALTKIRRIHRLRVWSLGDGQGASVKTTGLLDRVGYNRVRD